MKKKIIGIILNLIMILMSVSVFPNTYDEKQYREAIKQNQLETVKELLESGKVELNSVLYISTRVSPLALACFSSAYDVAYYLIDKGADLNGRISDTALCSLVFMTGKHREWSQKLYKQGEKNPYDLAIYMLKKGANPNDGGDYIQYPLMSAASSNDAIMVKILLKYGAKRDLKNRYGKTAATLAAEAGYTEIANLINGVSNEEFKNTLFYAAKEGDLAKVKRLIKEAGSNATELVQKVEKGSKNTALHYASRYGHYEIAELLVSYGSSVNAKAVADWTPLTAACIFRRKKIALLLIKHGANPNVVQSSGCAEGYSPFYWAAANGMNEVLKAMWDTGKVNPYLGQGDIFFITSKGVSTLDLFLDYCKIKPSQNYLSYLSELRIKDPSYEGLYQYFKNKGYYQ